MSNEGDSKMELDSTNWRVEENEEEEEWEKMKRYEVESEWFFLSLSRTV